MSGDLNLNAIDSMQPSNNVGRMFMARQYYNGAVSSPFPGMNFGCKYKDLLKQTMLRQEAIFRDQVYQLHHLYRRQRELIDGIKRDGLNKQHKNLESLQPNHVLPKLFGYVQETCHASSMESMNQLPSSNADNNIMPLLSVEGNHLQESSYSASAEDSCRKSVFAESKCKKFIKKNLDLELPAYEYLDSEEDEFLKVDNVTQVPQKLTYASWHGEKEQPDSNTDCNAQKDSMKTDSISSKANFLVDLNVPVNLEEEVTHGIPDMNLEYDCKRLLGCKVIIDLNSSIDEDDDLSMPCRSTEIDLEAPVSPENKESLPPNRESDGNQVETPSLSSGQEDVDLQEELVNIAAEAIVSISSFSVVQNCSEKSSSDYKVCQNINFLYWFADVASSVVDDPDSVFGLSTNVDNNDDGCLTTEIDYFEAMTLQLEAIRVDEYYMKTMATKGEEKNGACLPPVQARRGRTRRVRQQREEFQSEILPSLASLSRHEVSEDLQLIGGLMEAAGDHSCRGSLQNAGRCRGKRPSYSPYASKMEHIPSLLLKKNGNAQVGLEERRAVDWGKITRRPRSSRIPSSKLN